MVGTLRQQGPYISNHSVLNNYIDTHQSFTWKEENILKATAGDLSSHTDKLLKINELEQLWRQCKANPPKSPTTTKSPQALRKLLKGTSALKTLCPPGPLGFSLFLLCVSAGVDAILHPAVFSRHFASQAQNHFLVCSWRKGTKMPQSETPIHRAVLTCIWVLFLIWQKAI